MTHNELLSRMSSAELTAWIAYHSLLADERKRAERRAKAKR